MSHCTLNTIRLSRSLVAENTRSNNYTKELVLLNHLITKRNGMEEQWNKSYGKIHILRKAMLQQNTREVQRSRQNARAAPRCPQHLEQLQRERAEAPNVLLWEENASNRVSLPAAQSPPDLSGEIRSQKKCQVGVGSGCVSRKFLCKHWKRKQVN